MNKIFIILLILASSVSAELQKLTLDQKRELDHILKVFNTAEKYPELWSAFLEDLKQFKGTAGELQLIKFFETRNKKSLATYNKEFGKAADDYQKNIFNKNKENIQSLISEAEKVFANVNKDSTSKSWSHMNSIKEFILPQAAEILKANPSLEANRFALQEMSKIVNFFKDGENLQLTDFENFTISRSITFADSSARKIMLENESKNVLLDIKLGIRDLNVMRLVFGKNALFTDVKLSECSVDHSKDMHEKNFFAHESPVAGKKTPWDRARNFSTSASGENIHKGSRQSYGANKGWYLSPGHFSNMFNNHIRIGLGSYERNWTQMFGK